jgi:hypothetical protein
LAASGTNSRVKAFIWECAKEPDINTFAVEGMGAGQMANFISMNDRIEADGTGFLITALRGFRRVLGSREIGIQIFHDLCERWGAKQSYGQSSHLPFCDFLIVK